MGEPGGHSDLSLIALDHTKDAGPVQLAFAQTEEDGLVSFEAMRRIQFFKEEDEGKKVGAPMRSVASSDRLSSDRYATILLNLSFRCLLMFSFSTYPPFRSQSSA